MSLPRLRPSVRFFSLGFAGLAGLLAVVAVGIHIYRMAGMVFTNYDDMRMALTVDQIRLQGWKAYYDLAAQLAVWQGRAYFYFSMIFFLLPFFMRSLILRATLSALFQLGATCSVGAVVGLYAGFRNAALCVVLTCASLPYWHTWYPVNGYLFVYHVPVILFCGSLAMYIRRTRGCVKPSWLRFNQVVSWTAFFVSLLFYESLLPIFFLLAVVVAAVEARRSQRTPQEKWDWSIVIRAWIPWMAGFAVWTVLYLGFRWLHPATYPGSALAGFGRGERGDLAASLFYYEAYSLPGANWVGANLIGAGGFGNLHRTTDRWLGTPEALGYGRFFMKNLNADGIVLAVLVLVMALLWLLSFRRETEAPPGRVGKTAALALVCAVISPLPLELTAKYRSLEMVYGVVPYLPGYYSFLAWCVVLALAFPMVAFALRRIPPLRLAAVALLACGWAVASAANAMSNDAIYREYAELTDKWKLVDRLAGSRWFAALPANSVFLAPGLWDAFPTPTWIYADEYWSTYFSSWAGRPVQVIRDPGQIPGLLRRQTPVFYCEHQWLPGRLDAVLAIDPILGVSPTDGYARSDSLLLISRARLTNAVVEYRSSASDAAGIRARIPEGRQEHGAYVSQMPLPDLLVGTARVTARESGPPPVPMVDFQRGFSASTERSADGHYWRWSDGKDGEGELNLVNLSSYPLTVRFRVSLQFNPQEHRTAFDFILPHGTETIDAAPGDTIERVWQLAPGPNRILVKCHAGRLPAPGDSRYIVFGMRDWSVALVEGKP
jgi:hypothetical protein